MQTAITEPPSLVGQLAQLLTQTRVIVLGGTVTHTLAISINNTARPPSGKLRSRSLHPGRFWQSRDMGRSFPEELTNRRHFGDHAASLKRKRTAHSDRRRCQRLRGAYQRQTQQKLLSATYYDKTTLFDERPLDLIGTVIEFFHQYAVILCKTTSGSSDIC